MDIEDVENQPDEPEQRSCLELGRSLSCRVKLSDEQLEQSAELWGVDINQLKQQQPQEKEPEQEEEVGDKNTKNAVVSDETSSSLVIASKIAEWKELCCVGDTCTVLTRHPEPLPPVLDLQCPLRDTSPRKSPKGDTI